MAMEQQSCAQESSTFQQFLQGKPRIILGSASSSRRGIMDELAQQYSFMYEVATADIDEQAIGCRQGDWEELVLLLAKAKASAIIAKLTAAAGCQPPQGFLITCDQVVVCNKTVLEKPTSAEQARAFIRGYSTAPASTVGSVVVTNLSTGQQCEGVDTATITFHTIPDDVTEQLIKEGNVFYCAGGLMVEHPLVSPLIKDRQGSLDSIMGLSKRLVIQLLPAATDVDS
ncbi:hypothetical protein WJX72_003339 [[Myrmecia] bisecta]|uniref:Maf-like protein n=1 Tax=[Myrmecia] bisecta TaxID=41462 RepID=A0AAW1QQN3_9CHLO